MSKLDIIVHPQAMLIISDHFSRIPYDVADPPVKYHVGILLGNFEGDKIVVLSALEVLVKDRDGSPYLDREFYKNELDLHKSIYPNSKGIGWYSLDKRTPEELLSISNIFDSVDDFDNLIFGSFSPNEEKEPLNLFIQEGNNFNPVDYTYEAELAERIAMLQLQSSEESQIKSTKNAFQSLDQDLAVIESYLQSIVDKKAEFDPLIVRECANISQWWDHIVKPKSNDVDDDDEYDDNAEELSSVALLSSSLLEKVVKYLDQTK